jgi:hypothetical protein
MIPINNSDTAWLIVSDYNQDNAIGYPDCLREDIVNPDINVWHYVRDSSDRVGSREAFQVGTIYMGDSDEVGGSNYVVGGGAEPVVGSNQGYIGG